MYLFTTNSELRTIVLPSRCDLGGGNQTSCDDTNLENHHIHFKEDAMLFCFSRDVGNWSRYLFNLIVEGRKKMIFDKMNGM